MILVLFGGFIIITLLLSLGWKLHKNNDQSLTSEVEGATTSNTCQTGLKSYALINNCGNGNYRYISYTCQDKTTKTVGDRTSCKSSVRWKEIAKQYCLGKSSCHNLSPTPTPIPSVTKCNSGLNCGTCKNNLRSCTYTRTSSGGTYCTKVDVTQKCRSTYQPPTVTPVIGDPATSNPK